MPVVKKPKKKKYAVVCKLEGLPYMIVRAPESFFPRYIPEMTMTMDWDGWCTEPGQLYEIMEWLAVNMAVGVSLLYWEDLESVENE